MKSQKTSNSFEDFQHFDVPLNEPSLSASISVTAALGLRNRNDAFVVASYPYHRLQMV